MFFIDKKPISLTEDDAERFGRNGDEGCQPIDRGPPTVAAICDIPDFDRLRARSSLSRTGSGALMEFAKITARTPCPRVRLRDAARIALDDPHLGSYRFAEKLRRD